MGWYCFLCIWWGVPWNRLWLILEIWNCPQLSSNKHIVLVFILCLVICMYTYRIHFLVCYLIESFGFFYNSIYCEYICVKCFFIVVVVATCWILSYIAATWFCCCMYSSFFPFWTNLDVQLAFANKSVESRENKCKCTWADESFTSNNLTYWALQFLFPGIIDLFSLSFLFWSEHMMKLGAIWLNVGPLDYYLVIPIIIENAFDVSVDHLWMV